MKRTPSNLTVHTGDTASAGQTRTDGTRRTVRLLDTGAAGASPVRSDDPCRLPLEELERRIREGSDRWEGILDRLTLSGMLPSRQLAAQVIAFFEADYWAAENARVEALRRHLIEPGRRRGDGMDLGPVA